MNARETISIQTATAKPEDVQDKHNSANDSQPSVTQPRLSRYHKDRLKGSYKIESSERLSQYQRWFMCVAVSASVTVPDRIKFWHCNRYGKLVAQYEVLTLGLDGIDGFDVNRMNVRRTNAKHFEPPNNPKATENLNYKRRLRQAEQYKQLL